MYSSSGGVVYDKSRKLLIICPSGKKGAFTIPSSVKTINDGAFRFCSGLTSVTIPSSVTSIGESAFHSCSSLTSVKIPSSVTKIGKNAFGYTSLTSITFEGTITLYGNLDGGLDAYGSFGRIPGEKAFNDLYKVLRQNANGDKISPGTYIFKDDSWMKQ
ncbi:MAG: leucine-rich repeat domain-containing protein [Treponema sp.]|jgi:hypothetical protein|nr:leucine-rich repeat domain-containing protein [Treponema sp.]